MRYTESQLKAFLEQHQPRLAELLAEAAQEAGGHYARMTPEERTRTAESDSHQLIASLLQETIDRTAIQAAGRAIQEQGIDVEDIVRLTNAMSERLAALVRTELPGDPELAEELLRRNSNMAGSFRANLTAAKMDYTLSRLTRQRRQPSHDEKS